MLKLAKTLLILILIFILTATFFRHTLCRLLISNAVSKATGLKLAIEDLKLDVLSSSLHLRGITLFNPPGFKEETLGKAKEIFIKYDLLGSGTGGMVRLPEVRAQISEINIIRNEQGSSNVAAFKKGEPKTKPAAAPSDIPAPAPTQEKIPLSKRKTHPKFLIDRLELSVEKVTFINYKADVGEAAVIIFTGEGPYVSKNVSNLKAVLDSVSAKGGLGNLLNSLSGIINMDRLKTTTKTIQNRIKGKIKDILPEGR